MPDHGGCVFVERYSVGRERPCSRCGKKPSSLWFCKECAERNMERITIHQSGSLPSTMTPVYCARCIPRREAA